ncbi:bestrophin family protein [Acinetobacter zhairhuonensis]|uniref:bestrophin family protein n=1 Tax=Acinetobacter sp. A7.4 TaxID=2919921 RepID=UPI001F4F6D16|nr:bestrophin family protein [Acinetobacter sp. A7.4]MCJ8162277.1 bestrophin family protein [Acinetobacter sp. A7.4]
MIVRDKNNSFKLLFAWSGTILPTVLPALLIVVFISAVLVYLSSHQFFTVPAVPAIGFTIFGVILSIFLSFRNNACYDRWWEGRKLWGALIANSRHLSRDSHVLNQERRNILMYRVMLFTHLLRDRLRAQHQSFEFYHDKVEFSPTELKSLKQKINASQFVLEAIQKDLVLALRSGEISDIIYNSLNQHIVELGNIQAGCDRILSTPLPFSYSVLLHRTVYCFCFILPFSLEASLGIWTPILVGLIAYLFLGLDALSSQIEEPFGLQDNDLPLNSIVRLIEREMSESLEVKLPPAIQPTHNNLT